MAAEGGVSSSESQPQVVPRDVKNQMAGQVERQHVFAFHGGRRVDAACKLPLDVVMWGFSSHFNLVSDAFVFCSNAENCSVAQLKRGLKRLGIVVDDMAQLITAIDVKTVAKVQITSSEFYMLFGWVDEQAKAATTPEQINAQVVEARKRRHEFLYTAGNSAIRAPTEPLAAKQTPECAKLAEMLKACGYFRSIFEVSMHLHLDICETMEESELLRGLRKLIGSKMDEINIDSLMDELHDAGAPWGSVRNRNVIRQCKWHEIDADVDWVEETRQERLRTIAKQRSSESLDCHNHLPGLTRAARPLCAAFRDVLKRHFDNVVDAWVFFDLDQILRLTRHKFENGILRMRATNGLLDKNEDKGGTIDVMRLFEDLDVDVDNYVGFEEFTSALRWGTEKIENVYDAVYKARKKHDEKTMMQLFPWRREKLPKIAPAPVKMDSWRRPGSVPGASVTEKQLASMKKQQQGKAVRATRALCVALAELGFGDPVEAFAFFDSRNYGYITKADIAHGLKLLKVYGIDVDSLPLTRRDSGVEMVDLSDLFEILNWHDCDPRWVFARGLDFDGLEEALGEAMAGRKAIVQRAVGVVQQRQQMQIQSLKAKVMRGLSVPDAKAEGGDSALVKGEAEREEEGRHLRTDGAGGQRMTAVCLPAGEGSERGESGQGVQEGEETRDEACQGDATLEIVQVESRGLVGEQEERGENQERPHRDAGDATEGSRVEEQGHCSGHQPRLESVESEVARTPSPTPYMSPDAKLRKDVPAPASKASESGTGPESSLAEQLLSVTAMRQPRGDGKVGGEESGGRSRRTPADIVASAGKFIRMEQGKGMVYEGEVMNEAIPHGLGIMMFGTSDVGMRSWHVGQFQYGIQSGLGLTRWADGSIFYGEFENGQPHGLGIETYANGSFYEGEMCKGKREGMGCLFGRGIPEAYVGGWIKGTRHGKGFTGKFIPCPYQEEEGSIEWVIKGHIHFEAAVETSCGRVEHKASLQDGGEQGWLKAELDGRCDTARKTAGDARDMSLLMLEKMVKLMKQAMGIEEPKPPAKCRFEAMSPRVARRVRKAGPLVLPDEAEVEVVSNADWAIVKGGVGVPGQWGEGGFFAGGWFAHAVEGKNAKSKAQGQGGGPASPGKTLKERIKILSKKVERGRRMSLPSHQGKNLLHLPIQDEDDDEGQDLDDSFHDDPLKGFVASNASKSVLKLARKFVGEKSGFRIPPLPLWMIPEVPVAVAAVEIKESRTSKPSVHKGTVSFARPPKGPARDAANLSPKKKLVSPTR